MKDAAKTMGRDLEAILNCHSLNASAAAGIEDLLAGGEGSATGPLTVAAIVWIAIG